MRVFFIGLTEGKQISLIQIYTQVWVCTVSFNLKTSDHFLSTQQITNKANIIYLIFSGEEINWFQIMDSKDGFLWQINIIY